MKAKFSIFLVMTMIMFSSKANENQEALSSDFLEFLVDMEEVTGDGFENWLETESPESHTNGSNNKGSTEDPIQ